MATPLKKIRIMLSSRNLDPIPDGKSTVAMADVRKELEKELQEERFCGRQLVEVWINEVSGGENGSADAWQHCMEEVDKADALVVIYNGHAGWIQSDGDIGICHAEMDRAYTKNPSKVWLILMDFPTDSKRGLVRPAELGNNTFANLKFAKYIADLKLSRGSAKDRESLKEAVRLAVVKIVVTLAAAGIQTGQQGHAYAGPPLDWSRLNYLDRKERLETAAANYLKQSRRATKKGNGYFVQLDTETLLIRVHGVPASFGIAEARDLVGRAYLHDHETVVAKDGSKEIGPVHIILCHKSCTESQVIAFIGHPDLFIVDAPFGLFVADLTSFVQAFFVTGCRDKTATVMGVQRVFDWVRQSGESKLLLARARSRQKILTTMAREIAIQKRRHPPISQSSKPEK